MAGLKPAARAFVRSVFDVLAERSRAYGAESDGFPRWRSRGDNEFVLAPRELSAEEACLYRETVIGLPESPERARFRAAVGGDSRLSPFIGQLVGTTQSARRVDEDTLERELLWTVWRATGSLQYTDAGFEDGYREWLGEILRREEHIALLAPLAGLAFAGEIDLPGGFVIGQLRDDEVARLLDVGLIPNVFGSMGFAFVDSRASLRSARTQRRGIRTNASDEDRIRDAERMAMSRDALAEVVDALRVYKRGRVSITSVATLSEDFSSIGWTPQTGGGTTRVSGQPMELNAAEASDFVEFWKTFTTARRRSSVLDAVIRRFSYAGERSRRDDEIVDLVAALEALLLSEIESRSELRFRTALRGALFIEGSGLARRDVQKQLRRAYDVRSAVAHGGTARSRDLRSATDETQTLDEFVAATEDLVRLTLRRAVECVAAGANWPPDWDGLTLGEAAYP